MALLGRSGRRRALRLAAAAWLVAALTSAPVLAAESLEYAVKANFLYKFGPFIDWPASAFNFKGCPLESAGSVTESVRHLG